MLLCNKNHGMSNLSLYATLVVVIITWNFSYIMTHFLILVIFFGMIHLLLPLSMISYLKFYVKDKAMIYFKKINVLVVKNVMIVEILTKFQNKYRIDINDQ